MIWSAFATTPPFFAFVLLFVVFASFVNMMIYVRLNVYVSAEVSFQIDKTPLCSFSDQSTQHYQSNLLVWPVWPHVATFQTVFSTAFCITLLHPVDTNRWSSLQGGCASKSLQNFHKHFKSVMPWDAETAAASLQRSPECSLISLISLAIAHWQAFPISRVEICRNGVPALPHTQPRATLQRVQHWDPPYTPAFSCRFSVDRKVARDHYCLTGLPIYRYSQRSIQE